MWNLALKTDWIISSGCGTGVTQLGLPTEVSWTQRNGEVWIRTVQSVWADSWAAQFSVGCGTWDPHHFTVGNKWMGTAQGTWRAWGYCSKSCLLDLTKHRAYQQWQRSEDCPWSWHLLILSLAPVASVLRSVNLDSCILERAEKARGEVLGLKRVTLQDWCFSKISM